MITFGGGIVVGMVLGMLAVLLLIGVALRSKREEDDERHDTIMGQWQQQTALLIARNEIDERIVAAIDNLKS